MEGGQSNRERRRSSLSAAEFSHRVVVAVFIAMLMLGVAALIGFSLHVWFTVYLGILLAVLIRSLSDGFTHLTRVPEKWSVPIVLIALIGLLALAGWGLAEPLKHEGAELSRRLPQAVRDVQQKIQESGLSRFLPELAPSQTQIAGASANIASKAVSVFSGTMQSLVTIVTVLFLGIYLAFSPRRYVDGIIALFPLSRRARARQILKESADRLRFWMFGQVISMAAVGVTIALGLYLMGIPLPLVLGFLAGLLDIIPIFGPIMASVPAILLGFAVSPWHALYVAIVFVVANQIESHILLPLIQRYTISLPPALTVFALLLMGSLFGFWGLLLAAPVTVTFLILVKRLYIGEVLGDPQGKRIAAGK